MANASDFFVELVFVNACNRGMNEYEACIGSKRPAIEATVTA